MRRLTMREVIGCTVFGCILGLVVHPQRARVYSPDGLSREEVVTIIAAIVASVSLTFGVYLWLVRREHKRPPGNSGGSDF